MSPLRRGRRVAPALALLLVAADAPEPGAVVSPAARSVAAAQQAIEARPDHAAGYNALAMAYARRARETSDTAFYAKAEQAVEQASRRAPGDLEIERTRVWILLGRHEFAAARERARALQRRVPDDVLVYGYLVDANVELGSYAEAEEAAQWMLDLRPGNVPGLTRAAYLRELFGDPDGALELMSQSYDRLQPAEVEDRAWVLTQIAHLLLVLGSPGDAERALEQALSLHPDYHYALAGLARVRLAQRRLDETAALLRRRYDAAPHPENLYDLALALERAGASEEAERAYTRFEKEASAESEGADNANRELVFYYVDRARRPEDALRVAERERQRRQDVFTRDAYAWALHANGRSEAARSEIQQALAVGVRDPLLFYHAGMIASGLGDLPAARSHFEKALALPLPPEVEARAREHLARGGP